jgi:hypothetical protein
LRLSNGELFNHDQFAFFCVSIDHNRVFDISWQLGVRHQVAVTGSGVTVTLSSVKEGEILAVATEGPWFYIRLPAGTYDITANFKGQTKRVKNLSLTKDKKVQQIFIWDLGTQAEP